MLENCWRIFSDKILGIMSLTSKIFLDPRYSKQDGTRAIKIRVTINRQSIEIPTGYTVNPKYWNVGKMEIKPNCPDYKNVTRLNRIIRDQRQNAEDKIISLQESGTLPSLTTKEIRNYLLEKTASDGLLSYAKEVQEELMKAKRFGNARVYRTLFRSINDFLSGKDIALKTVTFKWLKSYETWYLEKDNTINGLSVHMRTLRALVNRAISEGRLSKEAYPFEKYVIRNEKTKKRAISEDAINRIKAYQPDSLQRERAKDFFLMSFYLMGASFVDLAYMRIHQIHDGRVEYKRKKTGQLHSIKITPALQQILDKYTDGKLDNDFVLNVISADDEERQYQQVRDELRRYNKRIKEIAKECCITGDITSYAARHSFATIAKYKGVPTAVISQALGHEDSKTTEIYLADFDNSTMDEFNDKILGT